MLELANFPLGFLYSRYIESLYNLVTKKCYLGFYNADPGFQSFNPFSFGESEKREQHMADELLKIKPEMHIGGLVHVFGKISCKFFGKAITSKDWQFS